MPLYKSDKIVYNGGTTNARRKAIAGDSTGSPSFGCPGALPIRCHRVLRQGNRTTKSG